MSVRERQIVSEQNTMPVRDVLSQKIFNHNILKIDWTVKIICWQEVRINSDQISIDLE